MLPPRLSTRGDVELRPDRFLKLPYYQTIPRNLTHQVTFTSITSGLDFILNTTSAPVPSYRDIAPWTKHLIPGGCQISDPVDPITSSDSPTAPLNCSEACLNSSLLFGSLPTLANCITISSVALTTQNSSLSFSSPTNTTALAQFGVASADLAALNGDALLSDVVQCAVASCTMDGQGGECSENGLSALSGLPTLGFGDLPLLSAGLSHFCGGFVASIDSDVAGPGACRPLSLSHPVLLSHVSQSYLALFFFLLVKLFNSSPRKLAFLYSVAGPRHNVAKLPKWQTSLMLSKPNAALISATVEFHEAQTFLVLAMQAATLATASFRSTCSNNGDSPCPTLESVASIAQSVMSAEMVRTLVFDSVLPVLLVQSALQKVGVKWWYTNLSTLLATSLAIIIQTWSRFPLTFSELFNHLKQKQPVSQCGNNPPLTVYCLGSLSQFEANQGNRLSMSAMPSPVWIAGSMMTVLLIDMIVRDATFRRYASALLPKQWKENRLWEKGFRHTVMLTIYRVSWVWLDLGLIVCVALHLQDLRRLTDGKAGLLSNPELWSYGQLISAMIWAPVMAKYVYYNIFGVKAGFEGRMANWYKVINERATGDESLHQNTMTDGVEESSDSLTPNHIPRAPRLVFTPFGALRVREPPSLREIQGRALRDQLQIQ
ncbi:hypothetical protein B0T20DRAFT_428392 [Sordaria brevicollis]|uniref:Transmembrane protein n=1 Tax=Sordaria brevicollis TaxID=83679 RepID=A0AAE0UG36_SORBR|nr:hypothetical protein B0T20DRAFT_428392 [Sordaria brevicollis]